MVRNGEDVVKFAVSTGFESNSQNRFPAKKKSLLKSGREFELEPGNFGL